MSLNVKETSPRSRSMPPASAHPPAKLPNPKHRKAEIVPRPQKITDRTQEMETETTPALRPGAQRCQERYGKPWHSSSSGLVFFLAAFPGGGVIARNGAPRANPFDSNGTGFVRPALHAAQIAPAETSSKAVVSLIVKETGAPGTTLEDHENKQPIVIGFARHQTRICARAAAQRCQERYHRLL